MTDEFARGFSEDLRHDLCLSEACLQYVRALLVVRRVLLDSGHKSNVLVEDDFMLVE